MFEVDLLLSDSLGASNQFCNVFCAAVIETSKAASVQTCQRCQQPRDLQLRNKKVRSSLHSDLPTKVAVILSGCICKLSSN